MDAQTIEATAVDVPFEEPTHGTAVAVKAATPSAVEGTAQVMSMIERLTLDTTIPIERAEQAFAFYQKVQAEQAKREFVAAFAACQSEMSPVAKDANNPQTRSRYASLAALDRAIRPIYTKHGFSMSFDAADSPFADHVRVMGFLAHKGGHERTYHIDMACDGKGAKGGDVMTKTHAMGSAFSYGKRYLLGNVFNIASAEKDADGNRAGGSQEVKLISDAQHDELIQLIEETKSDLKKFLELGGCETLLDMPASEFENAKRLLITKRNAMNKQGSK